MSNKSVKLVAVAIPAVIVLLFVAFHLHFGDQGCRVSVREEEGGRVVFNIPANASSECKSRFASLAEEAEQRSYEWALKQLNNN